MTGMPNYEPPRRVLILGASNVSRSIGAVVHLARAQCDAPGQILIAAGYGRSYGAWSSLLGRSLPGIRNCGIWEDLAASGSCPTKALITDIGNDLLYEHPPERIADWIEACLERLTSAGARTILSELPLGNLEGLSAARFQFFRRLFVPRCRLSQLEITARARALNQQLLRLAERHGATVVKPRRDWYGLDPIHIRYARAWRAWQALLMGERANSIELPRPRRALGTAIYLRTRLPAERRWGSRLQQRAQPAARLADGTTIAFY